jgi:hypothetical protein
VPTTGIVVGSATGGAQGAGTINATGIFVNGASIATVGSNNTWTANNIFSPVSGVAVTANGVAGSFAVAINGSNSTGNSKGLLLEAGTNSSDFAALFTNAANTHNYFALVGDGSGTLGFNGSTSVFSWNAAGDVTLNAPASGVGQTFLGAAGATSIAAFSAVSGADVKVAIQRNASTFAYIGNGSALTGSVADFAALWGTSGNGLSLGANNTEYMRITSAGLAQAQDQGGTLQDLGWRDIPQNAQSGNYSLALVDRGKSVTYTGAGGNTFTIPANSGVAFPIGAAITIPNNGSGSLTIAITTDTLKWAPPGTTGSRTLASNGLATILKIASTTWMISGVGLS